ncbi:MAG: hypothetical protein Q8S21_05210 [Candidatus Paracaedibacteraceae bacterium]|nr:hypothetical protein [Candidatus Paracaedibacteraceae bacterium]
MSKDVLLIRSSQFHLAVPTNRLLEIVNLKEYHAQQDKNLKITTHNHIVDKHRLWRNHVLPVVHLGHHIEPTTRKGECSFGLVYQASEQETIYIDVDHVFGIINIDTSKMKPVYHCKQTLKDSILYTSLKQDFGVLAFVLEDSASNNTKKMPNKKHYNSNKDPN